MKELGLIATYEDYLALPSLVREHARLLIEAEATAAQREARRNG